MKESQRWYVSMHIQERSLSLEIMTPGEEKYPSSRAMIPGHEGD